MAGHETAHKGRTSILASILVVNWNGREALLRCLDGLRSVRKSGQYEVIVVDNGSRDGSSDAVRQMHPWVALIENEANMGYAHANNQAYFACSGKYVLLLNPDTQITLNAIEIMVQALQTLPKAGAVTGRLIGEDGEEQHYIHAFPTLARMILLFTFLRRLLPELSKRMAQEYFMTQADFSKVRPVPQPPGACLMIDRAAPGSILMDERLPLFFNDVDLCRRIWNASYMIYYVPTAIVQHTPNRGGVARAGRLLQIEYAVSMMRYFRKRHPLWEYIALRLTLSVQYLGVYLLSVMHLAPDDRSSSAFAGRSPRSGIMALSMLLCCRSFFETGSPDWN